MKRLAWTVCGWLALLNGVHAEYALGAKHPIENDLISFDAIELFMDGKRAGYIDAASKPVRFSDSFYVYARCPVDRVTKKPNDYCTDWFIYDNNRKANAPLALPGLGFSSAPSFSWPYIAYVKVPKKITAADFRRGGVDVWCVVVEWPSRKVVAQQVVKVSTGHFETDAPESFPPPQFIRRDGAFQAACLEENGKEAGNVIATVKIPG